MSATRDLTIDSNLVSNNENVLPVEATYTKYTYEKIPVQAGNPQAWLPGSTLVYASPQYDDSVYDLDESYVEAKVRFVGVTSYVDGGGAVQSTSEQPLSGYSTLAVEKYFMSSLLENLEVQYGGTSVRQFETSPSLFPTLHAVYSTVTADDDKVVGNAEPLNFFGTATGAGSVTIDVRNGYNAPREWSTYNDCSHPFNVCQASDSAVLAASRAAQAEGVPFDVQINVAPFSYLPCKQYSNNHQYRSSLILNPDNTAPPAGTGLINSSYGTGESTIVMKLKIPLADCNKKLPANIPLRFTLRRSRNVALSLCGNAQIDGALSGGTDVTNANSSTYDIRFSDFAIYLKRLVLSENAKMVLYEQPSMLYDSPAYSAQQFNLTSNSFNQTVSLTSAPQFVLVGLLPIASLNPNAVSGGFFNKVASVFDTPSTAVIGFNNLYLNTALGRIPEQPYDPVNSSSGVNRVNVSGSMRAYQEFKKVFKAQNMCPIQYNVWRNVFNWYAFLVNNNGENPQEQANRRERSNINVVAQISPAAGVNLSDYVLVVISQELNQMVVSGLKNVTMFV